MKFVPKQPTEGINVSKTHPLVEASTLVVGLTAIFAAIAVVLILHCISYQSKRKRTCSTAGCRMTW